MRKAGFLITAILVQALSAMVAEGQTSNQKTTYSSAKGACSDGEKWSFGSGVSERWRWEIQASLSGKTSPARGFAEALALRKLGQTNEAKALGEYFISRSLLRAKLVHIAYNGLQVVASKSPTPETLGIQTAALECINRLQREYPTFPLSERLASQMESYLALQSSSYGSQMGKEVVYEWTENWLRNQIAEGVPTAEQKKTLALLKDSGPFEYFGRLNHAARSFDYATMVDYAEKFTRHLNLPEGMKRFRNYVHLMAGRAYFGLGHYTVAQNHYKLVDKSSNELTQVLTELSWAYLMDGKQREAMGTALNLNQGGFIHTFSPEAPMVMAMGMNELCQYPDSLKSINLFKKNYEKPYLWLSKWRKLPAKEKRNLYPLAIQFLQREKIDVPTRVGSEWIHSPTFLSHQQEINLLLEEEDATKNLGREAGKEQWNTGQAILKFAAKLKKQIKEAKVRMKPGDDLPQSIQKDLSRLRDVIVHYQRFRRAAPVWRMILDNFQRQAVPLERKLVAVINNDLIEKNERMLSKIQEVAENNQLIEVEIYNGATGDIIWQNAHPDYKEVAEKIQSEAQKEAAAKVYDWGRMPASDTEVGEVWEDELGSFKAEVFDNCSNKEKYLAIKRAQIRERLNKAQNK